MGDWLETLGKTFGEIRRVVKAISYLISLNSAKGLT
jgi:hypothetical protein